MIILVQVEKNYLRWWKWRIFWEQQTKAQYKKQQFENKLNSWKNKPLHEEHLRNIDGKYGNNSAWAWLKLGTLKKETEGLIFAVQKQALQTNVMKAKIQGISAPCGTVVKMLYCS